MKTIENKTSKNIEAVNVETAKNQQVTEQVTEQVSANSREELIKRLRKNVDIIIRDKSRYAEARQQKLSEKLSQQKANYGLIMHQAANGLRLDNLNGSTSVADAIGNMIRICNNIDKGRYPELKAILDNNGINVATLKAYVRLSEVSDYNKFLSKAGIIDYSRVIGAMCQKIEKEYKKNKKNEDKNKGKAATTDKDKTDKAKATTTKQAKATATDDKATATKGKGKAATTK